MNLLEKHDTNTFNNTYLKLYKNGIKLTTHEQNPLFGKSIIKITIDNNDEYLYWNKSKHCWFGKKILIPYLINNGALWFSKYKYSQMYLDMNCIPYGKGYILIPNKTHKDYGKKYYNNGWWIKTKNGLSGWFFKKQYLTDLMINGVNLYESYIPFSKLLLSNR